MGQVGSGKSSLISAILGEMQKLQGNVIVQVGLCCLTLPFAVCRFAGFVCKPLSLSLSLSAFCLSCLQALSVSLSQSVSVSSVCLSLPLSLSFSLSFSLSLCLSVCLSLSLCLSVCLSLFLSLSLSLSLSTSLPPSLSPVSKRDCSVNGDHRTTVSQRMRCFLQ